MQRIVTAKVKNTSEKVCKAYSIFDKAILKAKNNRMQPNATECNETDFKDFQTFLNSLNEEFNGNDNLTTSSDDSNIALFNFSDEI